MLQSNDSSEPDPTRESSLNLSAPRDALTEILRAGAQKMLAAAIEQEVAEYVADRTGLVDEDGRRLVVRNGFLPEREIMTGVGTVPVKQPRVRDKRFAGAKGILHASSSAKVPPQNKVDGRVDSLAVPQGNQHQRFPGSSAGVIGN